MKPRGCGDGAGGDGLEAPGRPRGGPDSDRALRRKLNACGDVFVLFRQCEECWVYGEKKEMNTVGGGGYTVTYFFDQVIANCSCNLSRAGLAELTDYGDI